MKKKVITLLAIAFTFNYARSQDFKIGAFVGGNELSYSGSAIVSAITYGGGNSSSMNIMKQDGFNLMETYWPDPWLLKTNYKPLAQLVMNNGMQMVDHYTWFKPSGTTPSHTGIYQFNASPTNPAYIGWNYDWLYNNIYNDPTISNVFYTHDLGTEQADFHYYPKVNFADTWCDAAWYYCYGNPSGPNPDWGNTCQTSGNYICGEIPPQILSDAIGYLKTTYPVVTHPICSGLAIHNNYVYDGYVDPCFNVPPCNGIYHPQDYITFSGVTSPNKPDIINEDSYYSTPFRDWAINTGLNQDSYLGKFKNIDYIHAKGYTHIMAEYDIAKEGNESIYQLHSNPNIQNANMLRFLVYTSIIHGVDGINFYTLRGSSGYYVTSWSPLTYALDTQYDPDGQDQVRMNNMNNTSLPSRFDRSNFPYVYQHFVSKLTRELRYLKDNGSITPNNSNMIYKKLGDNIADPNGIVEASANYLPSVILSNDATDYNAVKHYYDASWPLVQNVSNPQRGEDHGIRYLITSNANGEAVMIVSNPNPYSIHNVDFDFTSITNPMISNAKVVDVLFDDRSVTTVTATNYKTDSDESVEAGTFKLLKKFSIPFCTSNKKITTDFGPFDVKVFNFKVNMESSPDYANGWQNVWTNNGNNTIGSWGGLNNPITTDKFIPIDFNKDGVDELLCVQSFNTDGTGPNPDPWASIVKYTSGNWNATPMWTNSGNGSFDKNAYGGWGIRAADKFIVGDFDGDGFNNELLCLQGDGTWSTILRSNTTTMNFDWYWSNYGNGKFNSTGTGWSFLPSDKYLVGDFDGDNKNNDLLCVQGINAGAWAILDFTTSPLNFNWHWGTNSGNLFDNPTWPISSNDEFIAGNYDGGTTTGNRKNEVLCMERTAGNRIAILRKNVGSLTSTTEWSVTNGNIAGWGQPLKVDDKVIVGDIDTDFKDEIMLTQSCLGCGWSTTEDLNGSNTAPQWNWSNHNYTGPQQNYIDDWRVNDVYASNVKYIFLKPVLSEKKHLLAFKNYGCGNFLISQYKTLSTAGNFKILNPSEEENTSSLSQTTNSFNLSLFPNPNNGSFTVKIGGVVDKIYTVNVETLLGQIVYSKESHGNNTLEIGMEDLPSGLYLVSLKSGDAVIQTVKTVVNR